MIPVDQRQPHDPANQQSGDCWKCCIASILDLPYEKVPHFVQMEEYEGHPSYWNATQEFLRPLGLMIAHVCAIWGDDLPYLVWGNRQIDYLFHLPGHWIASVVSPRTGADGRHLSHAVVMMGTKLAFDPHPLREEGHLGFTGAYVIKAV